MTPDEQTVERVAKAMAFDRRSPLDASEDDNDFWAHTGEQAKDDWRGTARAAIAAMSDTTQARNDALREALSHKWLCFHKCDVEIEVVNAEDIIALIEGANND